MPKIGRVFLYLVCVLVLLFAISYYFQMGMRDKLEVKANVETNALPPEPEHVEK